MKILQVIPSLEVGGAETMCEGLSRLLKAQGQDVTVVSLYRLETPITRRLQEAGVALRYLDKKPGLDPGCVLRLRRLLKREKPDVIHVHLKLLLLLLSFFLLSVSLNLVTLSRHFQHLHSTPQIYGAISGSLIARHIILKFTNQILARHTF